MTGAGRLVPAAADIDACGYFFLAAFLAGALAAFLAAFLVASFIELFSRTSIHGRVRPWCDLFINLEREASQEKSEEGGTLNREETKKVGEIGRAHV